MTWRPVCMPKNGTNTVQRWTEAHGFPGPLGHRRAHEVAELHPEDRLYGIVRHPLDWYRSWYAHCMRAGSGNRRVMDALAAYGRGSVAWYDVLYGLTHPEEVRPHAMLLPLRDHLLNPAGDQLTATTGGLWSRSVRWFFMQPDSDAWAVDRLVGLRDLRAGLEELYGVDASDIGHDNRGDVGGLRYSIEMSEWVHDADGTMGAALARLPGQATVRC